MYGAVYTVLLIRCLTKILKDGLPKIAGEKFETQTVLVIQRTAHMNLAPSGSSELNVLHIFQNLNLVIRFPIFLLPEKITSLPNRCSPRENFLKHLMMVLDKFRMVRVAIVRKVPAWLPSLERLWKLRKKNKKSKYQMTVSQDWLPSELHGTAWRGDVNA